MRLCSISNVLTIATAGSLVAASPSGHKHHHDHLEQAEPIEKRIPDNVKIVTVPGPTVVAYELNGQLVEQSEVCHGIKDGSLKWADDSNAPPDCSPAAEPASQPIPTTLATAIVSDTAPLTTALPVTTALASSTATPSISGFQKVVKPNSVQSSQESSQAQSGQASFSAASSSAPVAFTSAPSSSRSSTPPAPNTISGGQGLDKEFPDGTVDCSTFPSDYGPIAVEWTNLGGWTGIQYVTIQGNSVTHIDTATPGGKGCSPGAMCSYACPAGYQKSQWPSAQGTTGQSVGGLQCNENGKLALTNPGLSKNLCIQGSGEVSVQNKLSNNAAICRTDYPGTEDEVVPLNIQPGSTSPLTCPEAKTYFKHDGDQTSAQYYINNQGVAVQSACTWGTDGSDMGNWAPSYLGVGQDSNGKTWLSISSTAQNNPSSYKPLNYTVEITGNTSGKCRLSNGKYCSGSSYDNCNDQGCTVELMSGQGTYVLSDGSN